MQLSENIRSLQGPLGSAYHAAASGIEKLHAIEKAMYTIFWAMQGVAMTDLMLHNVYYRINPQTQKEKILSGLFITIIGALSGFMIYTGIYSRWPIKLAVSIILAGAFALSQPKKKSLLSELFDKTRP